MSFKRKLISAATSALAVVAFSTFVSAQDTTQPNDSAQQEMRGMRGGKRGFGRGMRGGKHGGGKMFGGRAFAQLNLTDAQKEQIRQIHESSRTANQGQHEEMRALGMKKRDGVITAAEQTRLAELKNQFRASREQTQNQVLSILTAEQRTQLEQMKEEMKNRRQQRRQNRLNKQNQTTAPQTDIN